MFEIVPILTFKKHLIKLEKADASQNDPEDIIALSLAWWKNSQKDNCHHYFILEKAEASAILKILN